LKAKGYIANMTVNQIHFRESWELIKVLCENKLVYGVGCSVTNKDWESVRKAYNENMVFHVIAGVHSPEIVDELKMEFASPKILILGYKTKGFGEAYKSKISIEGWLEKVADNIGKTHMSFDNLAIDQLGIKSIISDEQWERFYMGNDFTHTMYIDGVLQQYSPTSNSNFRVKFSEMKLLDFFRNYSGKNNF
jgi:hypothetical protein